MPDEDAALGEEEYVHGYTPEHRAFLEPDRDPGGGFLPAVPQAGPAPARLRLRHGRADTTSLAEWLSPGQVVGFDREQSQVAAARAWAAEKGVTNVRFELGNVYEIGYPDASFDAVFAYTVLEHTREPLRAIREMRRVLRPGGVIGLCDPDYEGQLQALPHPALQRSCSSCCD